MARGEGRRQTWGVGMVAQGRCEGGWGDLSGHQGNFLFKVKVKEDEQRTARGANMNVGFE